MNSSVDSLYTHSPDKLVACFEGLGNRCEFGIVQSFCGAEPLGLFRFAALPHDKLIELLATRFDALDDPNEIGIFTHPGETEWIGCIPRYGIEFHTRRSNDDVAANDFLPRVRQRVTFLKRKLLEQLADPDIVFLRRDTGRSAAEIGDIHHALQAYAPHRLLWVGHTDDPLLIGSVMPLRDRLATAAYGYFWPDAAPSPAGLGVWLRVLDDALRVLDRVLWEKLSGQAAEEIRVGRDVTLPKLGWHSAAWASAMPEHGVAPVSASAPVVKHVLHRDNAVSDGPVFGCETPPLGSGGLYVLSAWVWLPDRFAGWVGLLFPGIAWIRMWPIDLARRGAWQRIVTISRMPADGRHFPGLVAQAGAGTTFFSTGWRIERGAVPRDCLRLPSELVSLAQL